MKRIIPILMALLLLSGCATQSAEKTYRQITMEEAVTMLEEETGYTILDVRTAQEYSEKHIPGEMCIRDRICNYLLVCLRCICRFLSEKQWVPHNFFQHILIL